MRLVPGTGGARTDEPLRVLVVDDEPDVREILRLEFQDHGWMAHTAASGPEAIQMLGSMPRPHVILLDIRMPEMSGFEVLRALKASASTAAAPVIILSCISSILTFEGAAAVVPKPFDFDRLMRVVSTVCHLDVNRRLRRSHLLAARMPRWLRHTSSRRRLTLIPPG